MTADALVLLLALRELVLGVTHRHKLPPEGLGRAVVAAVAVDVLELLGVLFHADVEAGERVLAVVLAHVLVVRCGSQDLLLATFDSSQRPSCARWHDRGLAGAHQLHLSKIAHLVLVRRSALAVHVLAVEGLHGRRESHRTDHLLRAGRITGLLPHVLRATADALELVRGLAQGRALLLDHLLARDQLAITQGFWRLLRLRSLLFVLDGVVVVEGLADRVVVGLPLRLLVVLVMILVLVQVRGGEVAAKVPEVLGLRADAGLILIEDRSLAVFDMFLVEVAALQEDRAGAGTGH